MPYYEHYWVPVDGISDLTPDEWVRMRDLLDSGRIRSYVEVGIGHLGTFAGVAEYVVQRAGGDLTDAVRCHGIDAFGALPPDPAGNNSHEGDVIRLVDAQRYLEDRGLDKVCELHEGDSAPILRQLLPTLPSPRLVFIDGNHTYEGCREDFLAADAHLVPGDVLILHDACVEQHEDYGRGPRGVAEDFLLDNPRYEVVALPPAHVRQDYQTTDAMCVAHRVAE